MQLKLKQTSISAKPCGNIADVSQPNLTDDTAMTSLHDFQQNPVVMGQIFHNSTGLERK